MMDQSWQHYGQAPFQQQGFTEGFKMFHRNDVKTRRDKGWAIVDEMLFEG
jgi:hypothetical protein